MTQEQANVEIFRRAKLLLNLPDEKESLLQLAAEAVLDRTLSYLNTEELPDRLVSCVALMAVSYWRSAGFGQETAKAGPVTSVKRGDVQTAFSISSEGDSAVAGMDNFFGWRDVLNSYRVVKFRCRTGM